MNLNNKIPGVFIVLIAVILMMFIIIGVQNPLVGYDTYRSSHSFKSDKVSGLSVSEDSELITDNPRLIEKAIEQDGSISRERTYVFAILIFVMFVIGAIIKVKLRRVE